MRIKGDLDCYMTLAEIAKAEGVSMQRIQEIIRNALNKIRRNFYNHRNNFIS